MSEAAAGLEDLHDSEVNRQTLVQPLPGGRRGGPVVPARKDCPSNSFGDRTGPFRQGLCVRGAILI